MICGSQDRLYYETDCYRYDRRQRGCLWNSTFAMFKNSGICGKPFNNRVRKKGMVRYLPTLWIMNTCPNFNRSLINWRYGEYVTSATQAVNDPKNVPQQKFSHDCMVLECLAKHHAVSQAHNLINNRPRQLNRTYGLTGRC